jgi:ectoine hydroxylase-related dioxygenase (phytanoyl-CoA dioxygenase family)
MWALISLQMLIPGSHKSNLLNPGFTAEGRQALGADKDMSRVPGAVEIFMKAGDVLLFVDSTAHGSAPRTNEGERRFALYRYGPNWGSSRCVLRFLRSLWNA